MRINYFITKNFQVDTLLNRHSVLPTASVPDPDPYPDPDPRVFCLPDPEPDPLVSPNPGPSIIMQK
jgi:hypothetical protein